MKNRACRRHHENRLKRRWRRVYSVIFGMKGDDRHQQRQVGLWLQTRVLRSCHTCGKPRKYSNELALQERRLNLRFHDDEGAF